MKTSITHSEYLQLLGLKSLADKHNAMIKDLTEATCALVGDPKEHGYESGHVADLMYDVSLTVEEALKRLNIAVVDEATRTNDQALDSLGAMRKAAAEHGIQA